MSFGWTNSVQPSAGFSMLDNALILCCDSRHHSLPGHADGSQSPVAWAVRIDGDRRRTDR